MFYVFYILLKVILFFIIFLSFIPLVISIAEENKEYLQIILMKQPDKCPIKSTPGDLVHLHFVVSLLCKTKTNIIFYLCIFLSALLQTGGSGSHVDFFN